MFCGQCGRNLPSDVRFCESCGRPAAPAAIPTSFTSATAAAVAPALSSSRAPGTASHQQLVKHYAEMSNEEFMNVAGDVASLEDDARIVIAGELRRRKLSESDIIQYRQDVAAFKPKDFWRQLRGVRGWLLLFCLGLVLVQPLALLFEAVNSGDAFVAGFNLLLGAFAIYTGIALWRGATNALKLVKVYFVVVLIGATLVIASGILTAPAARVSQTPSQDNPLTVGFRMLIGVAIWWSYFKKSKRVKATYGANL